MFLCYSKTELNRSISEPFELFKGWMYSCFRKYQGLGKSTIRSSTDAFTEPIFWLEL